MRKIGFFLVLFFCLLILSGTPVQAGELQISGKSAVLLDQKSGQVLYDQDKDAKLSPASTTKILTTILAIESGKLDDIVTIGPNPPLVDGTRVYLESGETVKLRDLVMAALVPSANDAALAIAEYIAGSQEDFARLMNEKAKSLGAVNSNFVNPHGLTEENHYTTAYDLAVIARYAMNNETFRQMVQSKVYDWEGKAWQTRLINLNKLLWNYDGADGVKTGYTTEAKSTLVASATRDDRSYISVILGSPGQTIWQDSEKILDYGFANHHSIELAAPGAGAATVRIDQNKTLQMVAKESFRLSLPNESSTKVESQLELFPFVKNIAEGDVVGQMVFALDGKEMGRVDLLAGNAVRITRLKVIDYILYAAAGFFFLQLFWIVLVAFNRKRKRRSQYSYRTSYRGYSDGRR